MTKMAEASGFLPETYEPPKSNSAYTKFDEGATKFRILCSPILGWEYWRVNSDGRKPVRLPYSEEGAKTAALEARKNADPKDHRARHFWAMKVWNYKTSRVEILEITQKGIQEALRQLVANDEWGNPVGAYDVTVTRSGVAPDVTYSVAPSPHRANSEEIEKAAKDTFVDLEALFHSSDPFDKNWKDKLDVPLSDDLPFPDD